VEPPLVPDPAEQQAADNERLAADASRPAGTVPGGWAHVTACHFPVMPGESLVTVGATAREELG
jgi:hypothetical protein